MNNKRFKTNYTKVAIFFVLLITSCTYSMEEEEYPLYNYIQSSDQQEEYYARPFSIALTECFKIWCPLYAKGKPCSYSKYHEYPLQQGKKNLKKLFRNHLSDKHSNINYETRYKMVEEAFYYEICTQDEYNQAMSNQKNKK